MDSNPALTINLLVTSHQSPSRSLRFSFFIWGSEADDRTSGAPGEYNTAWEERGVHTDYSIKRRCSSFEMRQNDKVKEAQTEDWECRGVGEQREASRPTRREAAADKAGSRGGQGGGG